ncbi:rod shape-determining protein MreC [Aurantibacillus circumpalustris]|uniref:rod shape-determining protein MreC n=1 Tax=Aurantibacillus circumpalustris TaxID=3036359 RepID=UPI00295B4A65|nr:rod shape-determining protein MreC [Aurantibacillus circumpalustris]
MKNLFAFILKHNFIFVFLFLQVICGWLLVQSSGFQGAHVLNSSNKVVANIYETTANTKEYFSLKQENEKLARENSVLRNFLKANYAVLPMKEFVNNDTLYKQQYSYINAKVVNSSVNKRRNYLTLNVGSEQGITQDMAVMASDGIVGIVTNASQNFSSAMSLLHKDMRVNCQLKKDGSYGPLIWDGLDYRYCLLTDIPTHSKITKGDTVITSELSGIFPEGIMVGTIESYERRRNESYYTAKVKLSADLKKVNHVYVIKNKFKNERDSIEKIAQKQIDD